MDNTIPSPAEHPATETPRSTKQESLFPHHIFIVPELLIQILSYLPDRDLLRCQLVSRHWKETMRWNLPPARIRLPDSAFSSTPTPSQNPLPPGTCREISPSHLNQPSHPIFQIPRVVTGILSHLSFPQIIQCQRVRPIWRQIMHRSPLVRKALFLQADGRPPPPRNADILPSKSWNAKSAWARRPRQENAKSAWDRRSMQQSRILASTLPYINPFLWEHFHPDSPYFNAESELRITSEGRVAGDISLAMSSTDFEAMVDEERASWRAMYVTQPPPTSVDVCCCMSVQIGSYYEDFDGYNGIFLGLGEDPEPCIRVEREEGVRMGDVVDEMRNVVCVGEYDLSEFSNVRRVIRTWVFLSFILNAAFVRVLAGNNGTWPARSLGLHNPLGTNYVCGDLKVVEAWT